MIKRIQVFASMIVGIVIGNVFPLVDFIWPKEQHVLKSGFLIKAGKKLRVRNLGWSQPVEQDFEFTVEQNDPYPEF